MGMCLDEVGNVSIEVRRESFIVHANYSEFEDPLMRSLASAWRELPHPEFLIEDLDDLIKALAAARKYLKEKGR